MTRYVFHGIARAIRGRSLIPVRLLHRNDRVFCGRRSSGRILERTAPLGEAWGKTMFPTNTLIGVAGLAFPEMLLEVDVTTVISQ